MGFRGLWTASEATPRALALLKEPLSHGESLMLRAAFDVWNGHGKMPLDEALHTLDGKNLQALGSLLVALGDMRAPVAIDAWLARWSKG